MTLEVFPSENRSRGAVRQRHFPGLIQSEDRRRVHFRELGHLGQGRSGRSLSGGVGLDDDGSLVEQERRRIRHVMARPTSLVPVLTQPRHLIRTGVIAVVVGAWLTAINEGDQILDWNFGHLLPLKVALNFLTPFVVANLGLLAGQYPPKRKTS